MTRKKYTSKIDRALDPIRSSKFYAKGFLGGWMSRNPKASKPQKLSKWREGYIYNLMNEQKK